VSYDPDNHEAMTRTRADKIRRIAEDIPDVEVHGEGDNLVVLSWGSTYGAARTAVNRVSKTGRPVSHVHLRHLNPMPKNLGEVLSRFKTVLVPEINMGQLSRLIRADYLIPTVSFNRIQGQPMRAREIEAEINKLLDGEADE
jgi:2-oxoglutarate ferredoxin oxidoreductase subunit alpha